VVELAKAVARTPSVEPVGAAAEQVVKVTEVRMATAPAAAAAAWMLTTQRKIMAVPAQMV
jgi:hypothetical protein